jgi:hypothetical protein
MSDSTPLFVSAVTALGISLAGMGLVYFQKLTESYPASVNILLGGLLAYLLAFGASAAYQQIKCKSVNVEATAKGNLLVFAMASLIFGVLNVETVPLKYFLFGQYPRIDPSTGNPFGPETREYQEDMKPFESNEEYLARIWGSDRYKIQFFSNLVTAVLPNFMVPVYWLFWLTLLPLYFLLKTQSVC